MTKAEFENRNLSGFPVFKQEILSKNGADPYSERVLSMGDDERERFLYQEFVRTHHAERIKCWVAGVSSTHVGVSDAACGAVEKLLSGLDKQFRTDLGMICESHHRDDLGNLEKYLPRRAYGSKPAERANLQYAALLLRTVDLLHITQDRTPSIAFELTNPSDPKSIEEWHKQMPVVAVQASPARDSTGNVDPKATPDTVEITATFHDPLGFFSLTEYLHYAEGQLRQSYLWAEQTRMRESLKFQFPWRKIDSTQVRAVGFESKHFAFELDKPKILKLLTGHTLYSNPNVVLRELIQNSLDAVRLQHEGQLQAGIIEIHLDTDKRLLTVTDNGTGMTQQIIEDHFLNVGSSRYRDENFIKDNPSFSAISRFGIGILSTFMISDEIEVITKPVGEDQARNISIRSLNGKYLIRLLEKDSDGVLDLVRGHGTSVRLRVRAGLELPLVNAISKFWIMFPGCTVKVQTDSHSSENVGYSSPKAALERMMTSFGMTISEVEPEDHQTTYKVEEIISGGVTVAIGLRWNAYFKNWGFITVDGIPQFNRNPVDQVAAPAACVQGIRVENLSPGFATRSILAISNVLGSDSPETNVARSNLEGGPLLDRMLRKVYDAYASHITREIGKMHGQKGLSISDSASEGRYLFSSIRQPLTSVSSSAEEMFAEAMRSVPWFTMDEADTRKLVTLDDLLKAKQVWTVESPALRSAEYFMRRVPGKMSLSSLLTLTESKVVLPTGLIVSGFDDSSRIFDLFCDEFEIEFIELDSAGKQANFRWTSDLRQRWVELSPNDTAQFQRYAHALQVVDRRGRSYIALQNAGVELSGAIESGIRTGLRTLLFRG